MTNEQINKIREISRLKLVFTIDALSPLTFRLFTLRGLRKMQRIMNIKCEVNDDNIVEIQDRWQKPKVQAYYKKEIRIKKKSKHKRK